MGAIQLFENYYESSLSAPDSILIDTFDINEIRQDFIISAEEMDLNILLKHLVIILMM